MDLTEFEFREIWVGGWNRAMRYHACRKRCCWMQPISFPTGAGFGRPVVPNGIPLSKIHHTVLDAQLIGIDPDCRLHVSERLLGQNGGPMLDALKGPNGERIHLPGRPRDYPDRDRLARRFELFKAVA